MLALRSPSTRDTIVDEGRASSYSQICTYDTSSTVVVWKKHTPIFPSFIFLEKFGIYSGAAITPSSSCTSSWVGRYALYVCIPADLIGSSVTEDADPGGVYLEQKKKCLVQREI